MVEKMLLVKNGYMIDPKTGTEGPYDIWADEGRIVRIEKRQEDTAVAVTVANDSETLTDSQDTIIDASGLVVAPGLVDVHVHFREPGFTHKEDIDTGARAAAKGGFTTVVLMANTKPAVDNEETLEYIIRRGAETPIHVTTCANVTMGLKGQELVDMQRLAAKGAAGFTDDGIPIMDVKLVRRAMELAKQLNMPISFHEEDAALIANNGINRGKASEYFGIGGSPREAEISLVGRDLQIALETGASINIQHISTKEAVELVRKAKCQEVKMPAAGMEPVRISSRMSNIHAEATPHHFTLTEEAAIQYGTLGKMNPPLREEADRQAIIRGLIDGTIDIIATDHAPHTTEEKAKSITEAPSGITGLETSLALGITELVEKGHLSLKQLLEKMSTNPADMYHLDAGFLAEGGPADLILIDPKAKVIAGNYASKSSNSPFTGWELTGEVKMTVCSGKIVYQS